MDKRSRESNSRKKKSGKFIKLLLLLALVLVIKNWDQVKGKFLTMNKSYSMEDVDIYDYKNGNIMGKYSEKEFRSMLIKAKNNYKYQNGKSTREQLENLKKYIPEAQEIIDNIEYVPNNAVKVSLLYPENFLWTYGFINDYEDKAGIQDYEKKEDKIYLMQTDSRWGYKDVGESTLGAEGCGPTSMAMVAMSLTRDYDLTPAYMMDYVIDHDYFKENVGTLWKFMSDGAKDFGLGVKELPLHKSTIMNSLKDGQMIIASVGPGDFTTGGHFIVLAGAKDGKIRVYDPNSWINSQKLWSYEKLEGQIKNLWAYSV